MKKIIIYTITIVVSFALVFCSLLLWNRYKANKMIKNFDKAFASKEIKMIFYGRKTCYFCQLQKPILKNISKDYEIDYLDIDGDLLSKKQKQHIIDALGIEGSTPVTAIVQNKKVLAVHVGYLDGKEYVDFLREAKMLPKDAVYKQEKYLNHIDYDEFKTLVDGILVLGVNADQDCIDLRISLNNISKKMGIKINYFNLSAITKDEFYDVVNDLNYMNNKKYEIVDENGQIIFPLIYIIKDSKIIAIIDEKEEAKIEKALKKYMK